MQKLSQERLEYFYVCRQKYVYLKHERAVKSYRKRSEDSLKHISDASAYLSGYRYLQNYQLNHTRKYFQM